MCEHQPLVWIVFIFKFNLTIFSLTELYTKRDDYKRSTPTPSKVKLMLVGGQSPALVINYVLYIILSLTLTLNYVSSQIKTTITIYLLVFVF